MRKIQTHLCVGGPLHGLRNACKDPAGFRFAEPQNISNVIPLPGQPVGYVQLKVVEYISHYVESNSGKQFHFWKEKNMRPVDAVREMAVLYLESLDL